MQAIVITGSPRDCFSTGAEEVKLREMLATAHANQQRMLGICFGSQALALALKGQAGSISLCLSLPLSLPPPALPSVSLIHACVCAREQEQGHDA